MAKIHIHNFRENMIHIMFIYSVQWRHHVLSYSVLYAWSVILCMHQSRKYTLTSRNKSLVNTNNYIANKSTSLNLLSLYTNHLFKTTSWTINLLHTNIPYVWIQACVRWWPLEFQVGVGDGKFSGAIWVPRQMSSCSLDFIGISASDINLKKKGIGMTVTQLYY